MWHKFDKKFKITTTELRTFWFSTFEAHFYLHGIVNSQKWRIWEKVPNEVNEYLLHCDKCSALCALSANGIIGLLFSRTKSKCNN